MKLRALVCILLQLTFELSACSDLQVLSGSTMELPCLSFQSDFIGGSITWKFNGKDVSAQMPGAPTVKKSGKSLYISHVTAANQGQYVCLINQDQMEIITTYNITVLESIIYYIKVTEGSDAQLPCNFPRSSNVKANALWFKETGAEKNRTLLNPEDVPTAEDNRVELMYPSDPDQTLLIRNVVMEDAGQYLCESAEGATLSSALIIVEVAPTRAAHTCIGFTTAWEPCQDENSRTEEPMLQESVTEFSMKLYSFLKDSQPSSNLLFSPISIGGALFHLLLGARSDTQKAIERALCVPHDFHCVHLQMKKLREKLAGSLQMASQIYYNPQMNLSKSFIDQSIQFYEAEPTRLLEASEENTRMINSWVANNTNNKIQHLVDSVSPGTQLMLLNAVSFSGQWKTKYEMKPRKRQFTKLTGDMVTVPVLYHQKYMAAVAHVVELKAQVARFALTGDSSLYILLPRSSTLTDLQQVEERMTDTAVHQMIEQLKAKAPQFTEVTLPKIKLDVQPDMNILIKKLGLTSLFEEPNLCGLYSEDRLVLDEARHRAFLALTEQGVEAAAATSASFSRSFPAFSALQPFIMLLWSDQTNVPLFIGRVTEP
ncbi:plasma protease C1 inhibitor [Centropristis striata]|uniref:plasma protease C1 inhibitor n=1 Tax=Centropristis striata TaxID=184440 RepID=UPI0027E0B940|nr:plasma protease C1 inhibitor [Centropristis striata]